ncbi:MAG: ABC transporter ATP-binding protein [Candidatus Velthaea sp.]
MNAIEVERLSKSYAGADAVRDVSFAVPQGSICGLLGPNGAGKSTTFKCMLGLAWPNAGRVAFQGAPLAPQSFEWLAFVPERSALFDRLTGSDHLEITRRAFRAYDARRAHAMLEIFSLDRRKRIDRLSKGQRTAMALVLAFAVRPRVMVLDEPASGLDPIHQRAVLDLLIEAAAQGTAVLLSSHQIGQVERAADRVVILKRGRVVLDGDLDELREREKIVEAVLPAPLDGKRFADDARIRRVERRGRTLRLYVHADVAGVMRDVTALVPASLTLLDQNLEELFFSAVEEPRPATLEAD